MQPPRIDVAELKVQLAKNIGPERLKRYFYYLNRLLSQKLNKVEFDRLCFRLLGRENLPLHNQFVRSLIKNSCNSKSLPPVLGVGHAKSAVYDQEQSGLVGQNQNAGPSVWSNGSILPTSPRKGRSNIRDRKLKDRPSSLGINGKADTVYHHLNEDGAFKTLSENGNVSPSGYLRLMHHGQGLKKSVDIPFSSHSKLGINYVEDGEEVEQAKYSYISRRAPLLAPLGIPLCSASVGGVSKALPVSTIGQLVSYYDSGGLFDNETLRKRVEQIASAKGLLAEVSAECSSILNSTLDIFLKRLINSCFDLIKARSGQRSTKLGQQMQGKLINGMWPNSSCGGPPRLQEQGPCHPISLLDFKVAMELNPHQLGDDWPLLLEKISLPAFKE